MLYSVLVISTLADCAEDWGSWILGTRHTEWMCVFTGMQCNNNIVNFRETVRAAQWRREMTQMTQSSGGGQGQGTEHRTNLSSVTISPKNIKKSKKIALSGPHPKTVPSLGQCTHLLCAEHRNTEHILTPRIHDSSFCCRTKWSRPKAGQKGHQIEVGAQRPNRPQDF